MLVVLLIIILILALGGGIFISKFLFLLLLLLLRLGGGWRLLGDRKAGAQRRVAQKCQNEGTGPQEVASHVGLLSCGIQKNAVRRCDPARSANSCASTLERERATFSSGG